MKLLHHSLSRALVVLLVIFFAEGFTRDSLGQKEALPKEQVVLQQKMFILTPVNTQSVAEVLNLQSLEGEPVTFDQLPAKAKEELINLAIRVFPHLELNDADPRDAIRIIIRKPKPRHMIRLGLIAEPKAQEADPSWMTDLSFGEKKLSCVVTNVSFLDLSIVLAAAFDLDFGVMPDGQPAFRNKTTADGQIKHRFYVVKSKSQEVR